MKEFLEFFQNNTAKHTEVFVFEVVAAFLAAPENRRLRKAQGIVMMLLTTSTSEQFITCLLMQIKISLLAFGENIRLQE